ncbi:hypothetical protein DB346_17065 [Verrucomicrobia bacterium LW23]|nr:hypothetical protein DB346_17065 [Verrucomicrobia bacterium LW23]
MRRGKASAPTASVSSQLQKDLEEEQARLRREIEEISARLEAPPGTRPPAAPGDPARPTIWRENEEESFTRPVPETPSRGRLAIQRQIERNRFLVIACVLLVVALIFYRVVW